MTYTKNLLATALLSASFSASAGLLIDDNVNGLDLVNNIIGNGINIDNNVDAVVVVDGARAVPEPMTVTLLGLGLMGLAVGRKKRA